MYYVPRVAARETGRLLSSKMMKDCESTRQARELA